MYNFLTKIFLGNKILTSENKKTKCGILAGIIGIVLNLILFCGKLILGILSFSVTIIADAINSLTDSISSFLVVIGLKVSSKPADEKHPYGYARFEYVTSLIIAVIILILGLYMLFSSIMKIAEPSAINVNLATIIFLSCALLVKIFLAVMFNSFGKQLKSPALIVAGKDSRNDSLSALAVLLFAICVLIWGKQVAILDGIFGSIVSLIIIISGFQMIKKNSSPLIGHGGTEIEIDKIKEDILGRKFVLDVHNVKVHKYGQNSTYVSAHIGIDGKIPLIECNNLINTLEFEVEQKFNIDLTIRVDAIDRDNKANVFFRNKINNILDEIDKNLEIDYISVIEKANFIEIQCEIIIPLDIDIKIKTLENIILNKLQNYKKDIVLILKES